MRHRLRFVCFVVAGLSLLLGGWPQRAATTVGAQEVASPRPVVRHEIKHDRSGALRTRQPRAPSAGASASEDVREIPRFPSKGHQGPPPEAAAQTGPGERRAAAQPSDQVAPGEPEAPALPGPIVNFEGIDRTDSPLNLFLPPDPNGAAGPNNYVQWVNVTFAIYDKAGNRIYGPAGGNTLWEGFGPPCENRNDGDPIVLYDRYANRWFFSQLASPNGIGQGPYYQCIAVSATADPTGAYNRYAFLISETKLNDYPKFGVWPDAYYMTINQYVNVFTPEERIAGLGAVAFERDKMVLGLPARVVLFDLESVDLSIANALPSDLDGPVLPPPDSPNYIVALKNQLLEDQESTVPQPVLQVFDFNVDWRNPQASTFTGPREIMTVSFNPRFDPSQCTDSGALFPQICIPQPNTTQRLDAIQDRLMFRLQYRHTFDPTFGDYETLVANHTVSVGTTGANKAGIRWYQLVRPQGSAWGLYQQGTYAPAGNESRWMASVAMDERSNIAVGYTVSGPTTPPSIRYTGRTFSDVPGTLPRGETSIVGGDGSQLFGPRGRWGDYSSMTLDPIDDCTFWYTQEYYRATSRANWATRIAAFRFPGCGASGTG